MSLPTSMKALVQIDNENQCGVRDHPVPSLAEGEVLVKVDYVALNPTDWKHVDTRARPGAIIGCDYTGTVVESAASKEREHVKVGQRVAGWVHGGLFEDRGSFAQYLKVPADCTFAVPEGMKPEEAATFGVPYFTAFHALVHSQKRGWPPQKNNGWALIYGGSSAVGFFAIQLAKLLGYKVVTACSPRNFEQVKSYGADEAFDYHNAPECVSNVRNVSGGGVDVGFDCVSVGESQSIAIQCFSDKPGHQLNIILSPDEEAAKLRPDVKIVGTLLYTLFGKAFDFGPRNGPEMKLPAMPEDREFFVKLCAKTPEYITEFKIRAPPITLREGLENIPQGFKEMRDNKISGTRLVYKV